MKNYPNLSKAISTVLQQLREEAGYSKRNLAMRSGIDRVYLLQVEQGKYRPTLNFIFMIAKGLNISPGKLVALIEKEQKDLSKEGKPEMD